MKTKFLNRFAALAFAALLCVATNAAFAQSRAGDNSDNDPVAVHQREQRAAATITNPGTAIAQPSTKSVAASEQTIDTNAPGFDANVMAAKPKPTTGKVADEYADLKQWVNQFMNWYNTLDDASLYLTKQQIDLVEKGSWDDLYNDQRNSK